MWVHIRNALFTVFEWLHLFFNALFATGANAKLKALLPLLMIGFSIVILMLIIKLVRQITWGG